MDLENKTDADLCLLARNNGYTNKVIDILNKRYKRTLEAQAYRIVGDSHKAEEVVQDSFIKLKNNLHKYQEGKTFFSWIYRIVHNKAVDYLRQKKPIIEHSFLDEFSAKSTVVEIKNPLNPYENLLRKELFQSVEKAINALPSPYDYILDLRFIEGLNVKQISEIFVIPEPTAWWRIHRGTTLLRKKLKNTKSFDKEYADFS